MIKALLFDKDGTLIDFEATFAPATRAVIEDLSKGDAEAAQRMARAAGFDMDSLAIAKDAVLIAGSVANIAECWFEFAEASDENTFLKQVDSLYKKHSLETLTAFSSLRPTLTALRDSQFRLGIATNDSEQAARAHMHRLGVETSFEFIAGFDSGHGEKPGPGMVEAFARFCDLRTDQVAMIGDSIHDCRAGRGAGARVVAVTSGLASEDELRPYADHVIGGIEDLPALMVRINSQQDISS